MLDTRDEKLPEPWSSARRNFPSKKFSGAGEAGIIKQEKPLKRSNAGWKEIS